MFRYGECVILELSMIPNELLKPRRMSSETSIYRSHDRKVAIIESSHVNREEPLTLKIEMQSLRKYVRVSCVRTWSDR